MERDVIFWPLKKVITAFFVILFMTFLVSWATGIAQTAKPGTTQKTSTTTISAIPQYDTSIESLNTTAARNINGPYTFYADKITGRVTLSAGRDFIEFTPDSIRAGNTVYRNVNLASNLLSGNSLTYSGIFGDGFNIRYENQPYMLKEHITIDSRSRLPVTMAGNIELNYSLKMTGTGFQISMPFITDSRGNSLDLPYTKTNSTLTIRIPASWLSTASYPVVIDPTVTYSVPGTSAYAETAGCIVGAGICEYSYVCSATTFGTKPTTSLLEPTCGDYDLGCPASPDGRVENDFYYAFNVSNITGNVTVSANLTVWFTAPNAGSMVYCTHVTSNSTQCNPLDTNDSYPQPDGKTGLNKLIFNVTNHVNLTYPIIWFAIYGTAITNVNRPQVNATLTINYTAPPPTGAPPVIYITSPVNGSYYSNTIIPLNVTNSTAVNTWWYRYNGNNTNITFTPNATFYAGGSDGLKNITVYANDSSGFVNLTTKYFYLDTTFPTMTIWLPQNTTYNGIARTFNYTFTEINNNTCWYQYNGINTTLPACGNATFTALDNQQSVLTLYINDTAGNKNSTSVTFTVDTVSPIIEIHYPQNATYNYNPELNFTYNETNPSSCWYSLNEAPNITLASCNTNGTVLTSVEGSNNVTLYMNDTGGNTNSTSVMFTIDTISPVITIHSPENNTYYNYNPELNFTYNETHPDSCWYSLNGAINITLASCNANGTILISILGQNNVTLYINDTAGNRNGTSVTFTVDTISPVLVIISPGNTIYETNPELNFTYNETNPDSCWYSLNGAANITLASCNTNGTILISAEGSNTVILYMNDTAGNLNFTTQSYTLKAAVIPPGGGGGGGGGAGQINQTIGIKLLVVNGTLTSPGELDFDIMLINYGNAETSVNLSYWLVENITGLEYMKTSETVPLKGLQSLMLSRNLRLFVPIGDYMLRAVVYNATPEGRTNSDQYAISILHPFGWTFSHAPSSPFETILLAGLLLFVIIMIVTIYHAASSWKHQKTQETN